MKSSLICFFFWKRKSFFFSLGFMVGWKSALSCTRQLSLLLFNLRGRALEHTLKWSLKVNNYGYRDYISLITSCRHALNSFQISFDSIHISHCLDDRTAYTFFSHVILWNWYRNEALGAFLCYLPLRDEVILSPKHRRRWLTLEWSLSLATCFCNLFKHNICAVMLLIKNFFIRKSAQKVFDLSS